VAVVRLAPGQVAYYDPTTRVHLTLANPTSGVPEWYDLSGLRRAHACGVVVLDETPKRAATEDVAGVSSEAPPQAPVVVEIVAASELEAEAVCDEVEQAAVVVDESQADVALSDGVAQDVGNHAGLVAAVEQPRKKGRKKSSKTAVEK